MDIPSGAELKKVANASKIAAKRERFFTRLKFERSKPSYQTCKNAFNAAILDAYANHTDICRIVDCDMVLNELACIEIRRKGYVITWCTYRRVYELERKSLRCLPFIHYNTRVEVGKLYTITFRPRDKHIEYTPADLDFDERWRP
jgi:hypothetical protein